MSVDFSAVKSGQITYLELSKKFDVQRLKTITNESIDYLLALIADLEDADVVFEPDDPEADDPYAAEEERYIGWSIAHVIAHITASSEEGAAFSSLLARGFPAEERPRYETPWQQITTKAQCVQRLEESRRMRLAYLDTWPDRPHLDVYRKVSERFIERRGQMNAPAAFLYGLAHEVGHYEQIEEAKRQALAARRAAAV